MKRVTVLALLFAGAGLSVLTSQACSGPTAPPSDAGFFGPPPTWETGGTYGSGSGTGGTFGGGGSTSQIRYDAGEPEQERRRDGGEGPSGGPGGRRRDAGPLPDASPVAACPAAAASGEVCMRAGASCAIPAGDAGRAQICTCRARGGEGRWRCETP
jgi:hypothetical protein